MAIPDKRQYLLDILKELVKVWPNNRRINIVCHGHSVPTGYTASHVVDTFDAYPHLLHRALKKRFPCAVINVIVTGVGGENAISGAARFREEVLNHKPDLITIDYGLNDRYLEMRDVRNAWTSMVDVAQEKDCKVLLLTPTQDVPSDILDLGTYKAPLEVHAQMIRELAAEKSVGLADSYAAFENQVKQGRSLSDFLASCNHPNRAGHELVVSEIMKWFPY